MKAEWLLAGVLAVGLVACDDTAQGIKKDAKDNAAAAKGAEPEAREVAGDVKDKAEQVADKAGTVLDAAKQTADVKAALLADAGIDGTDIDVDTSTETKTVTLSGTVKTAEQKKQAESIAKSKAEGYAVVNNLQVAAGGARAQ